MSTDVSIVRRAPGWYDIVDAEGVTVGDIMKDGWVWTWLLYRGRSGQPSARGTGISLADAAAQVTDHLRFRGLS